jgi:hypothetical protein
MIGAGEIASAVPKAWRVRAARRTLALIWHFNL